MIGLPQFCAVLAATEEGFDEAAVLTVEGVSADDFAEGCTRWLPELAIDDTKSGLSSAQATLTDERLASQERHRRPVAPIDTDLEGWVTFLLAFESGDVRLSTDPSGVTAADLARLSRAWEARLAEDSALAKRAVTLRAKLKQEGGSGEPLNIELAPHQLAPSNYAGQALAEIADPVDSIVVPSQDAPSGEANSPPLLLPLDVLAELDAWLEAGRLQVDWLQGRKGLLAALAQMTEGGLSEKWLTETLDRTREQLDTDAQGQQDYRLFKGRADEALERGEQEPTAQPPLVNQRPPDAMPLQIAPPESQTAPLLPEEAPGVLDQTMGLEGRVLRLDPLPFTPRDAKGSPVPIAPSAFVRSSNNLDSTVGLDPQSHLDDTDPLPFRPALSTAANDARNDAAAEDLDSTAALDVALLSGSGEAVLPFVGGEGRLPERTNERAAEHLPSAAHAIDTTSEVRLDQMVAGIQRLPAGARRPPMSVENYAHLVATTEPGGPAATGDQRKQAHVRVRIGDEVARVAVDAIFVQHFREQPNVYATFWELLGRWRLQMRRQGATDHRASTPNVDTDDGGTQ